MKFLQLLVLVWFLLPLSLLAERASSHASIEVYDLYNITRRRADPDPSQVFADSGPLFLGFDPSNNNLNAVKTAIIEAVILARLALPHVRAQSSIYRRYFQPNRAIRVEQIYSYLYGDGHGPHAMRLSDWPLRFVWLDSRFIGIPWEEKPVPKFSAPICNVRCPLPYSATGPLTHTRFWTNPPDKRSPAILICSNVFFGTNIVKLSLDAWSKVPCDDIPDYMEARFATPALYILHELTHWTEQTKSATGCEAHPVIVGDYGIDARGEFANPPGLPKHGYGAFNCVRLNQRMDLDSSKNADSYAWMAKEAWLNRQCPGRDIKEPAPDGPAEFTDPRDIVVQPDGGT